MLAPVTCRRLATSGLVTLVAALAPPAPAAVLTGAAMSFESGSDVDAACPSLDGTVSGPIDGTLSVSVDAETGAASFSASVTGPPSFAVTGSGSIDSEGNFSGTWSSVDTPDPPTSGSFSGTASLSGGVLAVNVLFTRTSGDCSTLTFRIIADVAVSGAEEPTGDDEPEEAGGPVEQGQPLDPRRSPGTAVHTPRDQLVSLAEKGRLVGDRPGDLLRRRGPGTPGPSSAGPAVRGTARGLAFEGGGLAAGGPIGVPIGLWGNVSYSASDDGFATVAFDQERFGVMGGLDLWPTERIVLGVALGYDSNDVDTLFNRGEQDIDGGTVAVYAGALLTDNLSADVSVAFTRLDIDQVRTFGEPAPVTSETEAGRWLLFGNLSYSRAVGAWLLTGTLGAAWARDDVDAFTESDGTPVGAFTFELGQLRAGAEAAYTWGGFEPFARGAFLYDWQKTKVDYAAGIPEPDRDRTGAELGIGVRYLGEPFSATVEYTRTVARSYDQDAVSVLVRGEF